MHSSKKGRFLFGQFHKLMKRKYVAQLFAEYAYLVNIGGVSRALAFFRVFRWFFALGRHTRELFRREMEGSGCVIFQGAASNDVFERLNPNLGRKPMNDDGSDRNDDPLLQVGFFPKAIHTMVEMGISMIHGSSTTGMMGLYDWCMIRSIRLLRSNAIFVCAFIRLIPLCWKPSENEQSREIPPEGGDPNDRLHSPPFVSIATRTDVFGLSARRCRAVLIGCGGLGSMFELFWYLLQCQLRALLITPWSQWLGKLPPLVIVDNYHPERGWMYGGLIQFLADMVWFKSAKQNHVGHVVVIRIVEDVETGGGAIYTDAVGEDVVGEDREGAEVRYFTKVDDAVSFFGRLLIEQVEQEATIRAEIEKGGDERQFLTNGTLYAKETIES